MKKILLFSACAFFALNAMGQSLAHPATPSIYGQIGNMERHLGAKTTTHYVDTVELVDVTTSDTPFVYSYVGDSGYVSGMNFVQSAGFAERYWGHTSDTSIKVLGVVSLFAGTVNPASTKNVTFRVWSPSPAITLRPTLSFSGVPDTLLDSVNVPITALHIHGLSDTFTASYFATPTGYFNHPFFVGYTINYNWNSLGGDTIGLFTTRNGIRNTPEFIISGGDTTVNNSVMRLDTFASNYVWYDAAYNLGQDFDYFIFAIVDLQISPTSVNGVSMRDLTYFGTYPNPSANNANARFSLNKLADVTILITDMSGRTIKTINQDNLSAGEHTIALETSDLPAGNYLCILRTSAGDGIASKMTVIK